MAAVSSSGRPIETVEPPSNYQVVPASSTNVVLKTANGGTADYIAASDCVVMPSRLEGLSLAAIEAACLGRPLIVTDLAAFAPFAGPATLVSRSGSVASLGDAIEQAAANRAALARTAEERMAHYRARFDITNCARRYLEAYTSAGADDAPAPTPRAA